MPVAPLQVPVTRTQGEQTPHVPPHRICTSCWGLYLVSTGGSSSSYALRGLGCLSPEPSDLVSGAQTDPKLPELWNHYFVCLQVSRDLHICGHLVRKNFSVTFLPLLVESGSAVCLPLLGPSFARVLATSLRVWLTWTSTLLSVTLLCHERSLRSAIHSFVVLT